MSATRVDTTSSRNSPEFSCFTGSFSHNALVDIVGFSQQRLCAALIYGVVVFSGKISL
jgi:hypothetical protein